MFRGRRAGSWAAGAILAGLLATGLQTARAADWPQWLGPQRDGTSAETGLIAKFGPAGPKVVWKVAGGEGISAVAVVGKRAFTMVQRPPSGGGAAVELAVCLDADTGKELWATVVGPGWKDQQGDGPRATPAVVGDRVYVQAATGKLACLNTADGKEVWARDLLADYKAKNIVWGLSASPVIDDGLIFAQPGARGAGLAAFDAATGKQVWTAADDVAAYASPAIIKVGEDKQVVFFTARGLVAVAPRTGKEAWRSDWPTAYDCNIATPLPVGGDRLFVASGEEVGCAMLKPAASGTPAVVWESRGAKSVLMTYWANALLRDGHLYGLSGEFSGVINLNCVDAADGKVKWSKTRFGAAGMVMADGKLYLTTRTGELVIVEAKPDGFTETARAALFADKCYVVPTIADGRLYFRDRRNVWCVDLKP